MRTGRGWDTEKEEKGVLGENKLVNRREWITKIKQGEEEDKRRRERMDERQK